MEIGGGHGLLKSLPVLRKARAMIKRRFKEISTRLRNIRDALIAERTVLHNAEGAIKYLAGTVRQV